MSSPITEEVSVRRPFDPTRFGKAPIGISLIVFLIAAAAIPAEATDVTFHFRPPEGAVTVTVAGDFNEWNPAASAMADSEGDGVWEVTLDVPTGERLYKFVVNGTEWFHDEHALRLVDDGYGGKNSVMEVGDEPMTVGDPDGPTVAPAGTEVTFRYRWGPGYVNAISVAGTFNDWNAAAHPMADEDGDGIWEVTVSIEPGEHTYQFVIDGKSWYADVHAERSVKDRFGGKRSIVVVGEEPMIVGEP